MDKEHWNLYVKECKEEIKDYLKTISIIIFMFLIPVIFITFFLVLGGYYLILGIIFVIFVYVPSVKCFSIYAKHREEWEEK